MEKIKERNYKVKVLAQDCDIKKIVLKVLSFVEKNGLKDSDLNFKIEIILRELLSNAIEHGCVELNDDQISCHVKIKNNNVILTIEDPGPGFAWRQLELAEMPLLAERGRGLPLIYQLSDRLSFNSSGNKATAVIRGIGDE